MLDRFDEPLGELPPISGHEAEVRAALASRSNSMVASNRDLSQIRSGFACALHMHQPLIPAGGADLSTARVISNLEYMMQNQSVGDNHNAPVFRWCYQRMAQFIPELVREGKSPRIMLEYSGTLLHGLCAMGDQEVIQALRSIATDTYAPHVEWLGCPWGHAVAPSTPPQDYRLHVEAFQHHFAALFGLPALARVRGFSPAEMALPNHPDVAYAFVKTLRDCGYEWILLQEHTVEPVPGGTGLRDRHIPHRLVARNSEGQEVCIVALIKTQGSDTKLVGQMQPYYEAKGLQRVELKGRSIPRLVSQIADGENGGVMMNEFPPKFLEAMREASDSPTVPLNGSEYLDHLTSLGIGTNDFPAIQPLHQQRIWDRLGTSANPERLASVIEELKREDGGFHVEGASWTNNISWVKGYDSVLQPMQRASALFAERILRRGIPSSHPRYRPALFHLLAAETSCFRYWGEGLWTDYGRELARRAQASLEGDLG